MFNPHYLSIILNLLLISQLLARPSDLSEGTRGTVYNFFQGVLLGMSDVCYYASMDYICPVLDGLLAEEDDYMVSLSVSIAVSGKEGFVSVRSNGGKQA